MDIFYTTCLWLGATVFALWITFGVLGWALFNTLEKNIPEQACSGMERISDFSGCLAFGPITFLVAIEDAKTSGVKIKFTFR